MDPNGKIALVTGGARMGPAVAGALARRGCDVALTYRNSAEQAEAAAAIVRRHGARALTVRADLAEPDTVPRTIDAVLGGLGGIDILICMASVYRRTPLNTLDEEAWRANLEVDLGSVYRLALASAPIMRERGAGRIIAFSDWLPASHRPRYRGWVPYYVAKTGVVGLVEGLALELAPQILVNAIAPGPILKPEGLSDEAEHEVREATPLGRWGGPEEIARTVLFLAETDFITGETIRVDGGRHLN